MSRKQESTGIRARLLLVDDDPKVARALMRVLSRDHDVIAETESRRALARVQDGQRFDAIVTDLSMPELSGEDLYAEISRIDPLQASKMLFITGGAFTPEGELFLASVPNLRITKPFEISVLRQSIETILEANDGNEGQPAETKAALATLADRFDLVALEGDPASTAFVDKSGSILWVNTAWKKFGRANGANAAVILPGQNYFGAIQGELGTWFSEVAASCIASGGAFETDYECSTPALRRDFRMRILPIPDVGFLITHTLRFEGRHQRDASLPDEKDYVTRGSLIVMCSNCRRVRRTDNVTWDWIPAWLEDAPVPVSHGLCHLCLAFYFG